jgi:hypothetical protein
MRLIGCVLAILASVSMRKSCKRMGCTVPRLRPRSLAAFGNVCCGLLVERQKEAVAADGRFAGHGGCGAVVEVIRQGINSSIRLMGCPAAIFVSISLR